MDHHHKHYLSIGCIFKNESHIIREWIEHYLFHGVDHIYMINDNSTDNFIQLVQPYIDNGYVTIYNCNESKCWMGMQTAKYNYYFKDVYKLSKWFGIFDLDEFLYSPREVDLKKMIKKYDNETQLMVDWVHFGSSGHIEQPENVVQSFLYRGEYSSNQNGPNGRYNSHKSIVKTDKPVVFGVHVHQYDGSTIGRNVSFTEDPENPDFLVNHYAIQSLNFWINVKMTRGDVNYYYDAMGWNRNRKLFDEMDVNDILDNRLMQQNCREVNLRNNITVASKGIIKINVWSGLCNQLIPLVSCINLANKYNKTVTYHTKPLWVCELNTNNYNLDDFFRFPEICKRSNKINTYDNSNIIVCKNEKKSYVVETTNLNSNNDIYVDNVVHLIGTEKDDINRYYPYPVVSINKNDFLNDIQVTLQSIDVIQCIKTKIEDTVNNFPKHIVGIHYRSRDGGFTPNNMYMLERFMNKFSHNIIFYLSSDCPHTEIYITNKFCERIITLWEPFGTNLYDKTNSTKFAIMNSICELYVLSQCNELYGTKSSSFTFTAWLLSKQKTLIFWN